jgi:hypothetical protein
MKPLAGWSGGEFIMRLFLLLLGNDEPAVAKAVAIIGTLHQTRRAFAHYAFMALAVAALAFDLLAAAVIIGGGQ